MWAAVAVALLVHGTILGTVSSFGLSLVGEAFAAKRQTPVVELAELKSGCVANALLGASARASMCLAPWRADTDECLGDQPNNLWIDLSGCMRGTGSEVPNVSLVEPKQAEKIKPIDPEPLLEAMLQQQKQATPPPPQLQQQPAQQAPPPPPPPQRPMQVVETAKPNNEKEPENARFLAEYNTHTDKETVARGAVKEPMVAKSQAAELTPKDTPKEASVKEHEDRPKGMDAKAPDVPGSLAMRSPGAQAPAELPQDATVRGTAGGASGPLAFDGYVPRKGDAAFEQQQHQQSEVPKGQSGAGGGAPEVPNLKPSQDVLERALGGGSVDHLDDVASADETALSAKRWVYASFFNRLKRQVAQNWDPASVWRRSDPTGQVYGYKTRVTEVRVSLSAKGDLAKIVVTSPSGVSELDDEAVRSFHSAAPFPNPPKELANSDGLITFAFSFYFEIGSPHTSWRVIRSM